MPDIFAHPLVIGSLRPPVNLRARLAGFIARRKRTPVLDPERTPDSLLRDIGILEGRGCSLRRPERAMHD
jgi:hypothetical protein